MKQKYDVVYSIGRDCACAMYMKSAHLRTCSGPFDWLTNATFETRIDLIVNDFRDFLNRDDIAPLKKDPTRPNDETCDYYQNIRNDFYYYHDFPVGVPFDKSFPDVSEKYRRRIVRFYDNVNKSKRVLFIWFSQYTDTPDDLLIDASDRICKKFGKQIDFLVIEHSNNVSPATKRQIAKNIVRYNLHTRIYDDGGNLDTLGLTKFVKPIYLQYAVKEPIGLVIRRGFRRILADVVCLFLPIHGVRGRVKHFIRGKYNKYY